jgi:hypothetical protein
MPEAALLRLPILIGTRNPETAIVRPVARRLEKRGLANLTGWQVWTRGEGEVCGVELSLGLAQPTRSGLAAVADALKLAPVGSSIRFRDGGEPLVFGGAEAVEVQLPRIDPVASKIAARCSEALGRKGHLRGWSVGGKATKLYVYGPEAEAIVSDLKPVLGDVPMRPRA